MEKVWLKSYEPGVLPEVDVKKYASIPEIFWKTVEQHPDAEGFTNMGVTQTYRETGELVNQLASFLQNHLKLPHGERVAIMMPNVLQYPIATFAILQAGLVAVNVNPLYTPRELEHQLNDSGATTIIVLENFANTLELVLNKTPVKNVIIASLGDLLGTVKGTLVNFVVRKVKKMVPNYRLPTAISFKQALSIGKQTPFKKVELNLEDLAFLQYTGGTTGVAKGAMLTHGNMCANMMQASDWIKSRVIPGKEIVITPLPLYHVFSLTVNLMLFTQAAGKNILITNPRDIPGFIKEMKKYKVTVMTGVNTLFNALVHNPEFATIDFSTWKIVLGGGMSVQKSVADKWQKITGHPLIEAYGLTETSPGVCVNPMNIPAYTGMIGLPIANTDVQLRNADGSLTAPGEAGELWVKGPQVMRGYWNRPDETAKVMDADGYLATGDVCVMDERGYFKLVDRKKDMIVVSGFNVYPNEIEDVVAAHPGVLEVACVGVPSEKTGEALKLFVVKKDPNLTAKDIIAFCRENLTAYKVPKDIEFRNELPKTNVGKILRRALRDESAA
ncbi:MAG: AMP-binding protein [Neisseria sp.]|nr:AMP-binding protein [Neisseria sp.]